MVTSLLLLVLTLPLTLAVQHYDAIVIGGGGGGANFAVSVKDAGYRVAVIEVKDRLGGHCDTRPLVPPVDGVNIIELGVGLFHNTSRNNERGFYNKIPYTVDLVEYVSRFTEVVPAGPFAFGGTLPSYTADVEHGEGLFADPSTNPDILTATITTVANYMRIVYPELEGADNPDEIRKILRLSVPDFFQTEPFLKNFAALFTGPAQSSAFLPFDKVAAYHVLKNLPGSFLMANVESGWMFAMKNGCQELYNNITNYLRSGEETENVFLSANVFRVTRPAGNLGQVTVHFRDSKGVEQVIHGDYLAVAIPQTLDNLQNIGLTLRQHEYDVFKDMEVEPGYFGFMCNAEQDFSIVTNSNFQDPLGELDLSATPAPLFMCGFGHITACNGFAASSVPTTVADMAGRITNQMQAMTSLSPLPVNLTVGEVVEHTGYFPHPQAQVLQQNPRYYGGLNALQGQSHTLWLGAGPSTAASTITIEHGNLLRLQFFPDKNAGSTTAAIPMGDLVGDLLTQLETYGSREAPGVSTWRQQDFTQPQALMGRPQR